MTEPTHALPEYSALLDRAWVASGCPSTRQIARRTGVSHTAIHLLLRGKTQHPSWRTLYAVGRELGANTDELKAAWEKESEAWLKHRTARRQQEQAAEATLLTLLERLQAAEATLLTLLERLQAAIERLESMNIPEGK